MKNYMRHELLLDDINQRWLDSFHKIHELLVKWNEERGVDCLLKNGTGDRFCDPSGQMQCGAFYRNGTLVQSHQPCRRFNNDPDSCHSINCYATPTELAFLSFFEFDHVISKDTIKKKLIETVMETDYERIDVECIYRLLCTISNIIPRFKPCHPRDTHPDQACPQLIKYSCPAQPIQV